MSPRAPPPPIRHEPPAGHLLPGAGRPRPRARRQGGRVWTWPRVRPQQSRYGVDNIYF